jgi:hypothetical protein
MQSTTKLTNSRQQERRNIDHALVGSEEKLCQVPT